MKTVTIRVETLDEVKRRAKRAFAGERQGSFITFLSVERMWDTPSPRTVCRSCAP